MSFFGNNNNTSGGFSGFGSTANTSNGFGASNTASSGALFGANTATAGTGGGFGGFGASNSNSNSGSVFGAPKTGGFGNTAPTSSGGGLFGNNNTSTAGGGFGFGNANNAASTSGFGGSTPSGGLFGANKPAPTGFGATNTGSIFGGGNTGGFASSNPAATPFGSSTNNNTFGATNNATGSFGGFGGAGSAAGNNNSGTANTPFQAYTEKDTAANQMSHFQTITFQDPYKNKSLEELRVEDYLQGRQYGNNNGQAGGFGGSGFGGGGSVFGANNTTNTSAGGGLFGNNNNNNTATSGTSFGGFGANNNSTGTGFGSSTSGGGLFAAQNKPATGGLFGGGQTSAQPAGGFGSTAGSGGGLFGGGFGANNTANNTTGGGMFGNTNQPKPTAFGGFGSNTANNPSTFGANNQPASGGLFGNTANTQPSGGLFGSNNNQAQPSGGLFGNTSNQPSGGLFGNQNKPAPAGGSLFGGNTNQPAAGGGLFGSTNTNNNASGGLFGSSNANNNTGGGLFGNQNKPGGTGTGLFGNTTNNASAGGGLFGNNNNNTQPGGSLFGSNNNAGGSLFGNQNKPAGTSMFGNANTNAGGGLFGTQANQPQNSGSLFGGGMGTNQGQPNSSSMFGGGNSLVGNNAQAPQQVQLHASLTQGAYGNDQLFASLGTATSQVGPLATPLTGAKPLQTKTASLLSSTRLNSPVYTPRASVGRAGGYGFSYSNYGTPGSAFSVSLTPGASSLLKPTGSLGSALTGRLAKSMSMNNLRGDGTPRENESLLRPTPGSASSRYLQTGSMRKLNIDRSLRNDLFSPPPEARQADSNRESSAPQLRKKVSFDNNVQTNGATSAAEPSSSNALVRTEEDEDQSSGLFRASASSRGQTNGTPEMQQVNGSSLSTVPENGEPQQAAPVARSKQSSEDNAQDDPEPGAYWMKPTLKDLKNMSRAQLSKVGNFVVGRNHVGRVEFSPCDLTNTDLDDICSKIVNLFVRHATVYPEEASKPAPGKGLNVPSTIFLENIWPRSAKNKKNKTFTQPQIERQIARLRKVEDTEFKSWDVKTGIWCFAVEHFTTYGLDDDGEDYTDDMQPETSSLSDLPATPELPEDDTMQSMDIGIATGEMDDTFQFKVNQRSQSSLPGKHVPGQFDHSEVTYDYDDPSADEGIDGEVVMSGGLGEGEMDDPFFSVAGAVQAPSPGAIERYHSSMLLDENTGVDEMTEDEQADQDIDLPGAFVPQEPKLLRSILKPTGGVSRLLSPEKLVTESWEEQLQRTMSPAKRDRQALKDLQQTLLKFPEADVSDSPFKRSMLGQSAFGQSYLAQKSAKKSGFGRSTMGAQQNDNLGKSQAFRTSMDIMNSLWSQDKPAKKTAANKGFENPYPKKPRLSAADELSEQDAAFHNSFKPSFATHRDVLLYSASASAPPVSGDLAPAILPIWGAHQELRFTERVAPTDLNTATLTVQKDASSINTDVGMPYAQLSEDIEFQPFAESVPDSLPMEKAAWRLASILFDATSTVCEGMLAGMSERHIEKYERRLRLDAFSAFWSKLASTGIKYQLGQAKTAEEKALLYLAINDIGGACDALTAAKDFKLATMVAQLPASEESQELMQRQISAWRERNDWGDFSDATRALYTVLSGETCVVEGKTGPSENRAATFCISERFGLSWIQSFGLRIYFGGYRSLTEATMAYSSDLKDNRETVSPTPWWSKDQDADGEDVLMGLLRLSASSVSLDAILDSETLSGSNFNSRLAWQLATLLHFQGHTLADEKLNQVTLSFAAELESAGSFVTAVWVLLHLRTNPYARRCAVQAVLERNAGLVTGPALEGQEGNVFELLTDQCALPSEMLWAAKAQYAKAVLNDPNLEVKWLLNAQRHSAAHALLCAAVGPTAVIEDEFDDLIDLLGLFPDTTQQPEGWASGGQVFADYAQLMTATLKAKASIDGHALMRRLDAGLTAMENVERNLSLEEQVAIVEMRRVLREEVREMAASTDGRKFELPAAGGDDAMELEGGTVGAAAFEQYREALGTVA